MANYTHIRGKVFAIGVNKYDNTKKQLDNAVIDASEIASKFRELGYIVEEPQLNVGVYDADAKFEDFCKDLKNFDVSIFYFAGHGIEIEGKNYLCFKDTQFTGVMDTTKRTAFDLQDTIKKMHGTGCRMVITIIDACRDNPFDENENRGWGSIDLAPIYTPKGTMVAYSTSPGETASDGVKGEHSIYTKALLHYLDEEGLEVEMFFKKVRSMVHALSGEKQTSWEHTSLIGEFSFNSGKVVGAADLGYSMNVICDQEFDVTEPTIGRIISEFRVYTYDNQASALGAFEKIDPRKLTPDQMFIVGRNILQAAVGNCWACQSFIKDPAKLARYSFDGANHVLNGILFEVYFNHECHFRGAGAKTMFLDVLMKYTKNQALVCSFDFITRALSGYTNRMLFVPSQEPSKVDINISLRNGLIDYYFKDVQCHFINSAKYNGIELLTDEENDIFPNRNDMYTIKELRDLLCKHYIIPPSYLNLNTDIDVEFNIWLDKRFRKSI